MKKTYYLMAALLTAAAILLAGCGKKADPSTFILLRSASVTGLDLHREITANNAFAMDKIYEPLVTFDENGELHDCLAETHTVSSDGLTYTFTLREGLKFSDGTPVTAADAVYSLKRHMEIGGPLPLQAQITDLTARDDRTLVITLAQAYTPFYAELAGFSNGIIPKDLGGKTEEEFFKAPVGTGPFVVSSWDPAGDLVFAANPYYRDGEPSIKKLIYRVADDDNQAVSQLRAGQADAVEALSYASAKQMEESGEIRVLSSGSWTIEEIFFNTLDERLADPHVRRALAMCLDRESLTQALTFGYGKRADTVLPYAITYNAADTVTPLPFDAAAAAEELKKSAYPDGFSVKLSIPSGNNTRLQIAQIFAENAKAVGIDVQIDQKEATVFRQDFREFNYQIMINNAIADYPDADSIFAFQVDPQGFSHCYWTSYESEEAQRLQKAGLTAPDGEERRRIYEELQQILADDVPYIPLYNSANTAGLAKNVSGVVLLPNGSLRLEKAVKK